MASERWQSSSLRAALLALLVAGCPPAPVGPPRPAQPSDEERARAVSAAFQGWTLEDTNAATCSVYFAACEESFQRRAGYDPRDLEARNPRAFMQSPDPVWLTGWDRLPADAGSRHVTFGALLLAAATREHFEDCTRRFEQLRAKRKEAAALLASLTTRLSGEANPYTRLAELVTLRRTLERSYPEAISTRYALELALYDAFVGAGREAVYHLQNQRAEQAALLRPQLSDADELDLECSVGLPSWQDPQAVPTGFVKTPITPQRIAELEARVKAGRDLEARLPQKTLAVGAVGADAPADPERLVMIEQSALGVPLRVTKLDDKTKDAALALTLQGEAKKLAVPYDCKESDKPEKVEPTGAIAYDTQCKRRDEVWKVTLQLRLAEPTETKIHPEDGVVTLGRVTKLEKKVATAKGVTTVTVSGEVEVVHVLEIWRRGLLAADYFVQ